MGESVRDERHELDEEIGDLGELACEAVVDSVEGKYVEQKAAYDKHVDSEDDAVIALRARATRASV